MGFASRSTTRWKDSRGGPVSRTIPERVPRSLTSLWTRDRPDLSVWARIIGRNPHLVPQTASYGS